MGQQQLIVIVLGAMVVGLATYGILKSIDHVNQTHDEGIIILQMNIVVTEAKKYAAKLESQGGGQGDFLGFTVPLHLRKTDEVQLVVEVHKNRLLFQGFGVVKGRKGKNKKTPVYVVAEFHRIQNKWTSINYVN